ncbi:hypothetical protein OF83DRAFT_1165905 [Amylostereum chailletii]|nr:hypothetical protein OF83DRAFT_1165905 [Amylostereum chailletii]
MSIDGGGRGREGGGGGHWYAVVPWSYRYLQSAAARLFYLSIQETPQPKWRQLANRRYMPTTSVTSARGDLTNTNVLVPQAMPEFVTKYPDIISRLKDTGIFDKSPHERPNHIIMNEYHAGQGIMPHEDGPSYYPTVATLSLGSHTVMHYYRYADEPSAATSVGRPIDPTPALSLLLEPRSLVITSSELYTSHLHGISETDIDLFSVHASHEDASRVDDGRVRVANWEMLTGKTEKRAVREGGTLVRGTRYSLTCRDVGRVARVGPGTTFGRR